MQHTWTSSKRRLPRHSSAICLMLSTTTQVLALLCSALHSAPLRSTPLHSAPPAAASMQCTLSSTSCGPHHLGLYGIRYGRADQRSAKRRC